MTAVRVSPGFHGVLVSRVSRTRVGVSVCKRPEPDVAADASVNQPATSASRSVWDEANKLTCPVALTGTMTRFARTSLPIGFKDDACGFALSVGHTVTKPAAAGLAVVTTMATAETPDDGTSPRPVIWTSTFPPADTGEAVGTPTPDRVSSSRLGVVDVNRPSRAVVAGSQ